MQGEVGAALHGADLPRPIVCTDLQLLANGHVLSAGFGRAYLPWERRHQALPQKREAPMAQFATLNQSSRPPCDVVHLGCTAGCGQCVRTKTVSRRLMDGMLGLRQVCNDAASYWSLLAPSSTMAKARGSPAGSPRLWGSCWAARFFGWRTKPCPPPHRDPDDQAEGSRPPGSASVLLVTAITLHNFPRAGVGGHSGRWLPESLPRRSRSHCPGDGIGLQNSRGIAVAMPLRREGLSQGRASSTASCRSLEPIAACWCQRRSLIRPLLPYALAFAAGAMIYVVIEELIPECRAARIPTFATIGHGGFVAMMIRTWRSG